MRPDYFRPPISAVASWRHKPLGSDCMVDRRRTLASHSEHRHPTSAAAVVAVAAVATVSVQTPEPRVATEAARIESTARRVAARIANARRLRLLRSLSLIRCSNHWGALETARSHCRLALPAYAELRPAYSWSSWRYVPPHRIVWHFTCPPLFPCCNPINTHHIAARAVRHTPRQRNDESESGFTTMAKPPCTAVPHAVQLPSTLAVTLNELTLEYFLVR